MKKFNKTITLVLIITFVFSPFLATKVNAQFAVVEVGPSGVANIDTAISTDIIAGATVDTAVNSTSEVVKDYGLDGVAWMIAKLIIERIVASTVKWINTGFKGSPAFVTDPAAYFKDIGDKLAGQYIFSNPNLNFLCGPISAKIKLALQSNYMGDRQWKCTLTQVGKNMDNFMSKFENGGWDNFFEMTQKTQNNPIGAYTQAENEMYLQIATKQGQKKEELLQGNGFLSYQKCKDGTEVPPPDSTTGLNDCDTGYNNCIKNGNSVSQCTSAQQTCNVYSPSGGNANIAPGDCTDSNKETVTPGSVISDQLNKTLGAGTDSLVTANQINEIVSALLNQVISHVVGGIGNGLRGLSTPDATNKGQIFTNQLTSSTATSTVSYFGETQNTKILDVPLKTPADYQAAGNNVNLKPAPCDPASSFYNPADPSCVSTP